jgi:subtilisin family serine protease
MATPFAAGQAALLLSMNPGLNVVQVADLMGGTAENLNPYNPGYPNQLGVGLINIAASLERPASWQHPRFGTTRRRLRRRR